jgi:hypothetical protein
MIAAGKRPLGPAVRLDTVFYHSIQITFKQLAQKQRVLVLPNILKYSK